MGPQLNPALDKLRAKYPAWVELVEREGAHVPEERRTDFVRMCREMRHLELEANGHNVKNIGNFVMVYALSKQDMTAVNHAIRVTERAARQKIATPIGGEWPE